MYKFATYISIDYGQKINLNEGVNMRINKYIASCGVASRRKAEELILNKKVKVNGRIIEELSF